MHDRRIPDGVKMFVLRWWMVGAVCFFVGFGTGFGASANPLDLVFLLCSVIAALTVFVFNPIIFTLYDIRKAGRIVNAEYRSQPFSGKILRNVREILKCYAVGILEFMTYQGLNSLYAAMRGDAGGVVVFPIEPVMFGLIFVVYYCSISSLSDRIVALIRAGRNRRRTEVRSDMVEE